MNLRAGYKAEMAIMKKKKKRKYNYMFFFLKQKKAYEIYQCDWS